MKLGTEMKLLKTIQVGLGIILGLGVVIGLMLIGMLILHVGRL